MNFVRGNVMVAIRRFIDVIFVEPKNRQYVILHNGKFWQLPRMNLTVSAWELKEPYTGALSDIFVTQSQVINGELGKLLSTYELPEQLGGLSATHFLAWWSNNDHRWQDKTPINIDAPSAADDELIQAALKKAQFITQNPNFADSKGVQLQLSQSTKSGKAGKSGKKSDPKTGNRTPTKKKPAPQTTPKKRKPAQTDPQADTPAKPVKLAPKKERKNDGNVFDNLLEDLMDDLQNI